MNLMTANTLNRDIEEFERAMKGEVLLEETEDGCLWMMGSDDEILSVMHKKFLEAEYYAYYLTTVIEAYRDVFTSCDEIADKETSVTKDSNFKAFIEAYTRLKRFA